MGGRGTISGMGTLFPYSKVQATLYHGTNKLNIEKFSIQGRESNGAIFFANDVDYAEEEAYIKTESNGGQKTIYEVKVDIRNPMTVTLSDTEFAEPAVEKKYIQQAKAEGRDAVIFKAGGDTFEGQVFYAVFSPNQVNIQRKRKV